MSYRIPRPDVPIMSCLEPDRVWSVAHLPTHQEMIRLSSETSGYWYRAQYTLTHTSGNRSEIYIRDTAPDPATGIEIHVLDDILASRATVQQLTGEEVVGWTHPQMARHINGWLGLRQEPLDHPERILPHYCYQRCIPAYADEAWLCDMRSAYWQVACRVTSPLLDITDELTVRYRALSMEQETAWEQIKVRLEPHKKLRLTLIGLSVAGWDGKPLVGKRVAKTNHCYHSYHCYYHGERIEKPVSCGPLQPLAVLAVRVTYELCQIQAAQLRSIYANVDCVVSERGPEMPYWEHYGIKYHVKAHGPGEFRGLGARRVGNDVTAPFSILQNLNGWNRITGVRLKNPILHRNVLKT